MFLTLVIRFPIKKVTSMITFFQKKERLCAFIGLLKVYPIHTPSLPQWQLLSYIYVNEIGEIIKPGFLTSHFASVLKANNMPRIRFHDLRHTCASLLFAQGVSLKEIQAWLGHSTIGTTANIYTHLDENNKLSSANAILSILHKK